MIHDTIFVTFCCRVVFFFPIRYVLGMLSSVLEEVEAAFDTFQFYKASQVTKLNSSFQLALGAARYKPELHCNTNGG